MTNAWAGGGDYIPQAQFDHFVGVAQQQMYGGYPYGPMQMPIPQPDPWYVQMFDVVDIFLDMGMPGYILLGCLVVGIITAGCFIIGRTKLGEKIPVVAFLRRMLRTWSNLAKGD